MSTLLVGACLALLLAAPGCGSSKTSEASQAPRAAKLPAPVAAIDPALDSLSPNFFATLRADSSYYIGFTASGSGPMTAPSLRNLRSIHSMTVEIFDADNRLIDSLGTNNVTASGTMRTDNEISVTATAGIVWKPASAPAPGTHALVTLHADEGNLGRIVEIVAGGSHQESEVDHAKTLRMRLEINDFAGSVEFVLHVQRTAPAPAGEYLPTTEKYRIEIRNDLNETVWSSSSGRIFAQSTGAVEPLTVGGEVTYRATWNGISEMEHVPTPPGIYTVQVTIPAKPTPYILREELVRRG